MRLDERFAAQLAELRDQPAVPQSAHITPIVFVSEDVLQAHCPQHGPIGKPRLVSMQGMNAVILAARSHDDVVHGVHRTDAEYRRDVLPPG